MLGRHYFKKCLFFQILPTIVVLELCSYAISPSHIYQLDVDKIKLASRVCEDDVSSVISWHLVQQSTPRQSWHFSKASQANLTWFAASVFTRIWN